MVLSESEAEARLAALHRERAALDRAIADLTLYLELGRRLTAVRAPGDAGPGVPPGPGTSPQPGGATLANAAAPAPPVVPPASPSPLFPSSAAPGPTPVGVPAAVPSAPDPTARRGDMTEGALARRHGRALIDAALAVLDEAGRPLHAGEIQAALAARGFAVPGHDPVAALNTRLWKRSGPGGPLRRLGDAVYVRAPEGTGEDMGEDLDA